MLLAVVINSKEEIMKVGMFGILTVIFVIIFSSCKENCACEIDNQTVVGNDSVKNFIDSIDLWKKFHLSNLESDSICQYRLAILPSYQCEKRIYTLVSNLDSPYMSVNYYSKMEGGKFIDTLFLNERIKLDKTRIKNFETSIKNNCFWTMKSDEKERLDGVVWLMEGFVLKQNPCTKRNSQIVWRKTKDSTFVELCNEFLKLANTSYSEQEEVNYKCWTGK